MAVFDVSQSVIARAAGIVQGSTDISEAMLADLEATLETMGLGSLLGLWLQSLLIHVTMWAINIVIFVIVYGRMIEIYLLTSLAPIPVATLSNRELGNTGQNYLKSLFAVGFQGLLILVCVAIYAVLIQGIATGGDPIGAIWGCMGYSVRCRQDLDLLTKWRADPFCGKMVIGGMQHDGTPKQTNGNAFRRYRVTDSRNPPAAEDRADGIL